MSYDPAVEPYELIGMEWYYLVDSGTEQYNDNFEAKSPAPALIQQIL